jgi:hypothetical protein
LAIVALSSARTWALPSAHFIPDETFATVILVDEVYDRLSLLNATRMRLKA